MYGPLLCNDGSVTVQSGAEVIAGESGLALGSLSMPFEVKKADRGLPEEMPLVRRTCREPRLSRLGIA